MDQQLKREWIPACSHSNTPIQCLLLSYVLPHYNSETNKDVFGCGYITSNDNDAFICYLICISYFQLHGGLYSS